MNTKDVFSKKVSTKYKLCSIFKLADAQQSKYQNFCNISEWLLLQRQKLTAYTPAPGVYLPRFLSMSDTQKNAQIVCRNIVCRKENILEYQFHSDNYLCGPEPNELQNRSSTRRLPAHNITGVQKVIQKVQIFKCQIAKDF
ncbi:Hypothetical_protein [Hexamita inflata]|uniref:Hypothetical_protein n=1 Tax=Hexamita inflata TaxID=28002 RepID=A0AA86QU97_9EUKA|nr:Hypothetical protein HINF_LOCUS49271 [Hexamita inflata]